jgi:hypothetical protein
LLVASADASQTRPLVTVPPGQPLPSGKECALHVPRIGREHRPENWTANATRPAERRLPDWSDDWDPVVGERLVRRIDGDFTGTTDEIIIWGACKWGFAPDIVRAMAARESKWRQGAVGDYEDDEDLCIGPYVAPCPTSFGLLQIKHYYRPGSYPDSEHSTSFNVDYALAVLRGCYEGWVTYLPSNYRAGDLWGCVGWHYSGQWKDPAALEYVADVRSALADRVWTSY